MLVTMPLLPTLLHALQPVQAWLALRSYTPLIWLCIGLQVAALAYMQAFHRQVDAALAVHWLGARRQPRPALLVNRHTGAIMRANAAACALYGHTPREFCRLHVHDLSAEPSETRLALREGHSYAPCRLHRKKDGAVVSVAVTAEHFMVAGRPYLLAYMCDIRAAAPSRPGS